MNSKEVFSIREWAPLSEIIERIPARIQRGIFPANLNITCIDAIGEFLALGSDVGIVFWYNRYTGEVQKLKAEVTTRITCVKIVNSVEYMVAAGNSNGQVSVFQIQKELPPDLNLVAPCTRIKPIERYTIRDLHQSIISCCEWSKNGMKLYSGDRNGVVVLTEFDYQAHLSKSVEILSETYEIVQLSVHQRYLLVSTLYRSIVCQRNSSTGQWHVTQVGKKDRKQLIDCGGTFLKCDLKKPLLICGRPGLRFWIADTEGNVEKTLLFKDAITRSPTWEIPILNPKSSNMNQRSFHEAASAANSAVDNRNFRNLYLYAAENPFVVTHDESNLYILNLDSLRVEAVARGFRKILDFCVYEKEIFILEGERSLLRLAPMPEKPNKTAKIIFNPSMPPPVPLLGTITSGTFESPVEYEPEEEVITNAEECFELPPVEALNLNVPIELAVESPRAEQNRRLEIFNQISEMDFDQSILHHSGILMNGRGRKKRKNQLPNERMSKSVGIVEIGQCAVQEEKKPEPNASVNRQMTTKPTLMDASFCVTTNEAGAPSTLSEAFLQHLPHVLSPTTLEKTIEEKTRSLAEELNLPRVHLEPISAEELRRLQETFAADTLTQSTAATTTFTQTPPSSSHLSSRQTQSQLMQLSQAYPKEDAGVQTTPRKKNYYLQDAAYDYSAGQPIDDICQTLRATTLIDNLEELALAQPLQVHAKKTNNLNENDITTNLAAAAATTTGLQFKPTQPINDEIDSFLLDFNRAADPLRRSQSPPPSTGDSTTSSEWEFLDN